ncbi:hypothetical protein C8J57DRAFT_1387082 [Mycena rebaudengoi]|nr:hypothetical protein C8J57DRAFT_1387082 [Mycena rebaudengoi]
MVKYYTEEEDASLWDFVEAKGRTGLDIYSLETYRELGPKAKKALRWSREHKPEGWLYRYKALTKATSSTSNKKSFNRGKTPARDSSPELDEPAAAKKTPASKKLMKSKRRGATPARASSPELDEHPPPRKPPQSTAGHSKPISKAVPPPKKVRRLAGKFNASVDIRQIARETELPEHRIRAFVCGAESVLEGQELARAFGREMDAIQERLIAEAIASRSDSDEEDEDAEEDEADVQKKQEVVVKAVRRRPAAQKNATASGSKRRLEDSEDSDVPDEDIPLVKRRKTYEDADTDDEADDHDEPQHRRSLRFQRK